MNTSTSLARNPYRFWALHFLLCFFSAHYAVAQSVPSAPQVVVEMINPLKPSSPAQSPPAAYDVANNAYIAVKIRLKSPGGTQVREVDPAMIDPSPLPAPGVYYLISVTKLSDGTTVPVTIINRRKNFQAGEKSTHVVFEIQDAPAVRRAKLEAWYAKVKASVKQISPNLYTTVNANDPRMLQGFDHQLIDNQLGQFRIIVSYVSNMPGTWNGQVDSPPLTINVVDKGTLLEK